MDPLPYWQPPMLQTAREWRRASTSRPICVLDGLLKRHPNLLIDNCASGGGALIWKQSAARLPSGAPMAARCDRPPMPHLWLDALGALERHQPGSRGRRLRIPQQHVQRPVHQLGAFRDAPVNVFRRTSPLLGPKLPWISISICVSTIMATLPLTGYSQATEPGWPTSSMSRAGQGLGGALRRLTALRLGPIHLHELDPRASYRVTTSMASSRLFAPNRIAEQGLEVVFQKQPDSALLLYERQ